MDFDPMKEVLEEAFEIFTDLYNGRTNFVSVGDKFLADCIEKHLIKSEMDYSKKVQHFPTYNLYTLSI